MPYIAKPQREVLDPKIDALVEVLRQIKINNPELATSGNLNYAFTRVLVEIYPNPRYDDMNTVTGVLSCTKDEYYRRVAAPYENQKAFENGDVYNVPPATNFK